MQNKMGGGHPTEECRVVGERPAAEYSKRLQNFTHAECSLVKEAHEPQIGKSEDERDGGNVVASQVRQRDEIWKHV